MSAHSTACETRFFVIFASIRFDAENVGNGIGELPSLFVLGIGKTSVDVSSLEESNDSKR